MFYFSCWCVLSLLRYIYIVKKTWIEAKISDIKVIQILSILAVFALSFFFFGINTIVLLYFGWPDLKVYEMSPVPHAIVLAFVIGTYFILLGISCFFYILIIREKGISSINSIVPCDASKLKSETLFGKGPSINEIFDEGSFYGGIWMGGGSQNQVIF